MATLNQYDERGTEELLVGRRIVHVEQGNFEIPGESYYRASGRLTLDDGTAVLVVPNQGGCCCGAGDYELARLGTVDNIITAVRLADESTGDHNYNGEQGAYRIFVVADAVEVNILTVTGDDGNGYYGSGYELFVVPGEASE